jgi:hypothetical protein
VCRAAFAVRAERGSQRPDRRHLRGPVDRQCWAPAASQVSVGPAGVAGMQRWPSHSQLRGPADRLPITVVRGPAGFAITTTGSPNEPPSLLDGHKRGSIYAP